MLIVFTNPARTRFGAIFAKNVKTNTVSLTFNYERSKHKDSLFTNLDEFKCKLKESIPLSTSENTMSSTSQKEDKMMQRLEIFCNKNNLKFERNINSHSTVDCYINGYKVQTKFVSTNDSTQKVSNQKFSVRMGDINVTTNYEKGDFDFFVIEFGGTCLEPEKYENNFCIISSSVLLEKGILKDKNSEGKTALSICSPDYVKNHWCKKYWNNIEEISKKVQENWNNIEEISKKVQENC
jgi:hypothetical protein